MSRVLSMTAAALAADGDHDEPASGPEHPGGLENRQGSGGPWTISREIAQTGRNRKEPGDLTGTGDTAVTGQGLRTAHVRPEFRLAPNHSAPGHVHMGEDNLHRKGALWE